VLPSSSCLERLLNKLSESKLKDQDVCVHDAVSIVEDHVMESTSPIKMTPSTSQSPTISRVFFWTHHTRVKQKKIYVWAKELRVTGIITVTKPGYLLVEAEKHDMLEFTKRNLAEHWKEIRVTWEEDVTVFNKSIDKSRWFPQGLSEITIPEFAASIRRIGQSRILRYGTRGAIKK
jgi:hypothetical protein